MPKKFNPELRDRAVRMVYDRQAREGGPRAESIRAIAPQLGVGLETLRIWCNRYGPTEPSAGSSESLEEENRRLRRELAESADQPGQGPTHHDLRSRPRQSS